MAPLPKKASTRSTTNPSSFPEWVRKVCLVYFVSHIPATLLVDAQALIPKRFVPSIAQSILHFHCEQNKDFLMRNPPLWLKSFIACELLVQLPLFFYLAKGLKEKNYRKIRTPGLLYCVHVMTTMVPILSEIVASSSVADKLFFIYFPYFFVPFLLFCALLKIDEGRINRPKKNV